MANFYKTVVSGTVGTQEIVNIFYFGRENGSDVVFDSGEMSALNNAVSIGFLQQLKAALPSTLTFQSIKTSMVNQLNEVTGFYDIETAVNIPCTGDSTTEGYGACAIVSFSCIPTTAGQTYRVPKRSYLAVGPISSVNTDVTGKLTAGYVATLSTAANAIATFTTPGGAPSNPLVAIRVGVANKFNVGAAGKIAQAKVQPFVSFRRSRMISPRGGN